MALPIEGTISFNDIVQELGLPSGTAFSLNVREIAGQRQVYANNTWVNLNMCSSVLPTTNPPFSIKAWCGYNHSEICCNNEELQWYNDFISIIAHPTISGQVQLTLALKPLPSPPNDPVPTVAGNVSSNDVQFEIRSFGAWNNVIYWDDVYSDGQGRWLWQTNFPQDNVNRRYYARKIGCTHTIYIDIIGSPNGTVEDGCSTIQFYNPTITDNGNNTTKIEFSVNDVGQTIEFSVDNGAWVVGNVFTNIHEVVVPSNGQTVTIKARIQNCTEEISGSAMAFQAGSPPQTVYYNTQISQYLQKQCPTGENGSLVYVFVAAGAYSSTISQSYVDTLAYNDAQAQANANGTCTGEPPVYYSAAISGTITKNDCPSGQSGSNVTVNIPYGTYTSGISQTDADNQAQIAAQNQANTNGTCSAGCGTVSNLVISNQNIAGHYGGVSFSYQATVTGGNGTAEAQLFVNGSLIWSQTINSGVAYGITNAPANVGQNEVKLVVTGCNTQQITKFMQVHNLDLVYPSVVPGTPSNGNMCINNYSGTKVYARYCHNSTFNCLYAPPSHDLFAENGAFNCISTGNSFPVNSQITFRIWGSDSNYYKDITVTVTY